MCICDSSYPRKLAFSYLDELSKEFQRSYEGKIEGVTRPYAFMGFGESPRQMLKQAMSDIDGYRHIHQQNVEAV